jgi:PKD repeat protein
MKNTLKLLGIAIAVLLTFGLVACGPDEGEEETPLSPVYIQLPANLEGAEFVPVNTMLTADYTGTETVKYQWQKYEGDEVSGWGQLEPVSQANNVTFVATAAGRYTVTVSLEGRVSVNAPSIMVRAAGYTSPYAAFLGTWKFDHDHEFSDNTTPARVKLNQTIVITENSFELTDTDGDYFKFAITSWEVKATNTGHTVGTSPNFSKTYADYQAEFPSGYTLKGKTEDRKSYPSMTDFCIYLNSDGDALVRSSKTTSSHQLVTCVYVPE